MGNFLASNRQIKNRFFNKRFSIPNSKGRLPPFGKVLQRVKPDFIENLLVKAINRFNAENYEIRALPFQELLDTVSRLDRVLTAPGGSLLLCGRSGVGRRTALAIASSMNHMRIFSPKISRAYGLKNFRADLKVRARRYSKRISSVVLLFYCLLEQFCEV